MFCMVKVFDYFPMYSFVYDSDKSSVAPAFRNKWQSGQPDNALFSEDCIEVHGTSDVTEWNDAYCKFKRKFLCEGIQILVQH